MKNLVDKTLTVSLESFLQQEDFFIDKFKNNKIFIVPTDTLYGISALFTKENIDSINFIKQRERTKKISIIAPSFERIEKHFIVSNMQYLQDCFNTYHGVTYVVQPKETSPYYSFFQEGFTDNSIGVRIIKHPLQVFVEKLGSPIISTSANISGEPNHTRIDTLSQKLKKHIDYIVDQGEIYGKPSVLVFVDEKKIIER